MHLSYVSFNSLFCLKYFRTLFTHVLFIPVVFSYMAQSSAFMLKILVTELTLKHFTMIHCIVIFKVKIT